MVCVTSGDSCALKREPERQRDDIIPSRITVGPHVHTVKSDRETAILLRAEGSRGDSRNDDHLIRIDPDRPASGVAETLLHETLHAVWGTTALRADDRVNEHEEVIITALAPVLLDVLRDNPDLTGYLTS